MRSKNVNKKKIKNNINPSVSLPLFQEEYLRGVYEYDPMAALELLRLNIESNTMPKKD